MQLDLIDLQSCPDGDFKWLLHYVDHGLKVVDNRALTNGTAMAIAYALIEIFTFLGAPAIIQTDNGRNLANIANKKAGSYLHGAYYVNLDPMVSNTHLPHTFIAFHFPLVFLIPCLTLPGVDGRDHLGGSTPLAALHHGEGAPSAQSEQRRHRACEPQSRGGALRVDDAEQVVGMVRRAQLCPLGDELPQVGGNRSKALRVTHWTGAHMTQSTIWTSPNSGLDRSSPLFVLVPIVDCT